MERRKEDEGRGFLLSKFLCSTGDDERKDLVSRLLSLY